MLTDLTSQQMVYSIFTRSLEYSNAINWIPLWSWCTTIGVVAGIGPEAALKIGSDPADPVAMFAIVEPDGVYGILWVGGMTERERRVDG